MSRTSTGWSGQLHFLGAGRLEATLRHLAALTEAKTGVQVATQCTSVADMAAKTFVALTQDLTTAANQNQMDPTSVW